MKNEVSYKLITTEIYRKIIEFGIIGIHFFSVQPPFLAIRNYVPKIVFVEIIVYDIRVKKVVLFCSKVWSSPLCVVFQASFSQNKILLLTHIINNYYVGKNDFFFVKNGGF